LPREVLDAGILADPEHNWGYTARAIDQSPGIPTRGQVLDGSSAVNAAVTIRPRPADFAK